MNLNIWHILGTVIQIAGYIALLVIIAAFIYVRFGGEIEFRYTDDTDEE